VPHEKNFPNLIKLKYIHDGVDGCLTVMENHREIPFSIKRVYYINKLKNKHAVRGMHAHKKLKQAIFCLQGSFSLSIDNGLEERRIKMHKSHVGVYLPPKVWHVMRRFSEDCVIMVVASDFYRERDYIRDYNEFKKYLKKHP